jgi:hypothetical protein
MTLHDACAFQQVIVRACVRNLMVLATFPLLVAQGAFARRVKREMVKMTSRASNG